MFFPEEDDVVKYEANNQTGMDIWGKWISAETGKEEKLSADGKETPVSAKHGAIVVDKQLLQLGREVFYKETFGNEVFLTDIMGIVNGPLTMTNIAKAIIALKGKGTINLQVELAEDIKIGGRTYKKEKIGTGIDVPKGFFLPLGMPVVWDHGKLRIGISCAACHATVDTKTKKVVEGAPNNDFLAITFTLKTLILLHNRKLAKHYSEWTKKYILERYCKMLRIRNFAINRM